MVFKLKNNREDVEVLLEYNYLHLFSWKIYNITLSSIAIVTPLILVISAIRTEPLFFHYIFISSIFILFMIGITLFAIYIFGRVIPKLMRKKLKQRSYKYYKDNQLFSAEKLIEVKNGYIEVTYNEKKFNIPLNKNILVDQFKGYIIISSVFMKNKIKKVYPLVIPINIFENERDKENFLRNIEKKILP